MSNRPKATLMLIAYQQEHLVAEAVESALAQNYSPLEIILSDDCSSDGTFEVMKDLAARYRGPHKLVLNRNRERAFVEHVNRLAPLVQGDFVLLGCGDDVFYPDRVLRTVHAFLTRQVSVVGANCLWITEDGQPIGPMHQPDQEYDVSLQYLLERGIPPICHGATLAWSREVWELFGPMPKTLRNLDWIVPFWGGLHRGNYFIPQPVLRYRRHNQQMSLGIKKVQASGPEEKLKADEALLMQRVANSTAFMDCMQDLAVRAPEHPLLPYLRGLLPKRLMNDCRALSEHRREMSRLGIGVF